MDAKTFDRLAIKLAGKRSRRDVLKGIVGLTAAASVGTVAADSTEAARRGFGGPQLPGTTPPAPCTPSCGEQEFCGIPDGCGGTCTCGAGDFCVDGECLAECEIQGLCAE